MRKHVCTIGQGGYMKNKQVNRCVDLMLAVHNELNKRIVMLETKVAILEKILRYTEQPKKC